MRTVHSLILQNRDRLLAGNQQSPRMQKEHGQSRGLENIEDRNRPCGKTRNSLPNLRLPDDELRISAICIASQRLLWLPA
jgi:hypothetical protein